MRKLLSLFLFFICISAHAVPDYLPTANGEKGWGDGRRFEGVLPEQIWTNPTTFWLTESENAGFNVDREGREIVFLTNGTFTITMDPAATLGDGFSFVIKNVGTGTITIDPNGVETIDGSATYALSNQYDTVTVVTDGSNWYVTDVIIAAGGGFLWKRVGTDLSPITDGDTVTLNDSTNTGIATWSTDVNGDTYLRNSGSQGCIGANCLASASGSLSWCMGEDCLENNTGTRNTAMGSFAGETTTGDSNVFIGRFAGNNTGVSFSTGIGQQALQTAVGDQTNAVGLEALGGVTGGGFNNAMGNKAGRDANLEGATIIGHGSAQKADALYLTCVGYGSCTSVDSDFSVGIGQFAIEGGTGEEQIGIGMNTMLNNSGDFTVGLGTNTLQNNEAANNTALGVDAFNTVNLNSGAAQNFVPGDVNTGTDQITITGHGFGAPGDYVNLRMSSTGTLPAPLSAQTYKFLIVDANTIQVLIPRFQLTSQGTGTHTATPLTHYTNSTALGYDSEPDASNQVYLGDTNVTEVKTSGGYTSSGNTIKTPTTLAVVAGTGVSTLGFDNLNVSGSGGAVVVTATPSIVAGVEGQEIELMGTSDTNLVTLQDKSNLVGSTLQLSGGNNMILGAGDILALRYSAVLGTWVECYRSDN